MTSSPTLLSIGTLSPVSMDSSIAEKPSIISPSTGIFSPGLIVEYRQPIHLQSEFCSSPALSTVAVFACNPINFLMASDERPFALASKSFPRMISVIRTALVS